MNMISTGAFQTEMDASIKQQKLVERFAAIWEKKNAKAARAGGVSLMALSLAACGSDSDTTTTSSDTSSTTTTTTAATTVGLTSNTDIVTLGSGNDTVMASGTSLGSDDVFTDAGGSDIIKASVAPAGNTTTLLNATGVETVQVTNTGAGDQTFQMTSTSGVTTVSSYLSTGVVIFNDLQANAKVVIDGSTGNVTAEFANAVVVGAADTANISILNDASATVAIGDTADEFETINIEVGTGKNTITDINDGAGAALGETSKIVISGSGQLTMGETVMKDASEIDGSAATGKLLITTDATVDKLTGGSADDTFTLTVADFGNGNAAKTIDGGAGNDTISVAADVAATTFDAASGGTHTIKAETLDADITMAADGAGTGTAATRSVDVAGIEGLTKVTGTITNSGDANDTTDATLAITGLATGSSVDLSGAAKGTHANAGAKATIALEDASATADAITVDADGRLEILDLDATADDATTTAVETGGIETLNITSSDVNKTTGKALTLTVDELEAYEVTSVTVSGSNKVTISELDLVSAGTNANKTTAALRAAEKVTIDASDATALFSLNTTETGVIAVTGGSGGIDVDMNGTATKADVITGGSATTDIVTFLDSAGGAATQEVTATGVETIEVETVNNGDDTISLLYVTGATQVKIMNDDGTTVSNVDGEKIYIETSATTGDFSNEVIVIDTLTSTTKGSNTTFEIGHIMSTTGQGDADSLDATVLQTDTPTMTIIDSATLYDSGGSKTNEFLNHAIDIQGASATDTVTKLVISGGGDTDGSTAAVEENTLTLVDNTNVALTDIDATGWLGNLNVVSLGDLQTAATITFGDADNTLTVDETDLALNGLVIDGGAGSDTLASDVVGTTGTSSFVLNAANVEILDLELGDDGDTDLADTTIDLTSVAGLERLSLSVDAIGATTVEKFDENLTINGVANNATIEFTTVDTSNTEFATDTNGSVTVNAGSGASAISVSNKGATGAVIIGNGTGGLVLGSPYKTATISNVVASDAMTVAKLTGAGLETLSLDAATIASNGALTISAMATANLQSLTVDSGIGAITLTDLGTVSKLETFTVDTGDTTASAKTTVTAGTSTSIDTITASGAGAFEITALTASSLDSVDASGVTGVVTIGSASAALTTAAGASIKSGTANDSITINMSNLNVVDAGEKTADSDTLVLVGAQNSGTTVINLASATDQIVNANGFAESNAQTGFENVNLSAVTSTGSYGFSVTANASGSIVTGGAYNDTINLGAGLDDVVLLAASGNGDDTINNFDLTSKDDLDIQALITGTITGDMDAGGTDDGDLDTDTIVGTGRAAVVDNGVQIILNESGTLAASDIAVAAANGKLVLADNAEAVVLVAAATTDTDFNVYYISDTDAGGGQTYAADLVATVDLDGTHTVAELAIGDLIIA